MSQQPRSLQPLVRPGSVGSLFRKTGRIVSWFSCGAASAVATKKAIEKYGEVDIYYCDTKQEHEDNPRFLADCEKWFGRRITTVRNDKYKDAFDVFEKMRFISSVNGAPCTGELKRVPSNAVWSLGDTEIFGYTADEVTRLIRWSAENPERHIECPLIDLGISKSDCFDLLKAVGIELPQMYKLGFANNNCRACPKARDSLDYWKRTRKHFPADFNRMAALERTLGHAINRVSVKGERRPIFLDEIPPGEPTAPDPKMSCGLFCASEEPPPNMHISNPSQNEQR